VVGGQLCDRALTRPTAEELAKHFTVINYDRRGRGDSGDTAPYALEREIEDLDTSMLKRVETLEDVGNVAAFAASDVTRSMTATALNITCGREVE
jgi:hypothetical protein